MVGHRPKQIFFKDPSTAPGNVLVRLTGGTPLHELSLVSNLPSCSIRTPFESAMGGGPYDQSQLLSNILMFASQRTFDSSDSPVLKGTSAEALWDDSRVFCPFRLSDFRFPAILR